VLTRLEVDGFKNLHEVKADFGPYTCIAGPNAVGKSNIFDAIQFLSLLATRPLVEAANELRPVDTKGMSLESLFLDDDDPVMRFAAEMLLPLAVFDEFGREARPTTSFVRYEVAIGYERRPSQIGVVSESLVLISESLTHITAGDAKTHLPWPHSKQEWRDHVIKGRRSGVAYISTSDSENGPVIEVHGDGGSRGPGRKSSASRSPRTMVAATNSIDDPTILTVKREMEQWRSLALEPTAMRRPDEYSDIAAIATNGAHMAATLTRLFNELGSEVLDQVAANTSALADVRKLRIDVDSQRELLTLMASVGDGPEVAARSLSDGTLRFLALCLILADPTYEGLICMEEPENGIQPGRIDAMVNLMRMLAVDPFESPSSANPLRQVIVNTHSPYFVQLQEADDLLLAAPVRARRGQRMITTVELRPLLKTWRDRKYQTGVPLNAITAYLRSPEEAQLTLNLDID
jgi:predicted ATPase